MAKVVHVGGFKLKPETTKDEIDAICSAVIAFKDSIPGVIESFCGPFAHFDLPDSTKQSYKGAVSAIEFNRGYTHGFYLVFQDVKSREKFETAKAHLEFGPIFTPHLEDNMNSVIVFDFMLP